jgi:hypothetical protein
MSLLHKINCINKNKKKRNEVKNTGVQSKKQFENLILANNISNSDPIWKWSNPIQAQKQSFKYLGKKRGNIYRSTKKNKKYQIYDDINKHMVSFGQMGYEDYTKHRSLKRRRNYLTRSAKISGNWKKNPFSANNLSRIILW